MPRLLPRLIDIVEKSPQQPWSKFVLPRKKRKSLYKPDRPSAPSLHPAGYKQSILLTENRDLITSSHNYEYHKSLPPSLKPLAQKSQEDANGNRSMTEEEQRWWCNPYLRMLSSPVRKCNVTERYLPKDFLVRLSKVRPANSHNPDASKKKERGSFLLMPSNLQHPKFASRDSGRGFHILCDKSIFKNLKTIAVRMPMVDPKMIHGLLAEQVGHLLRLRVLQELELLGDSVQASASTDGSRIVRRLTREEWDEIRETGIMRQQNAIAVIVVPPLQKNPVTGKRPEPSMSAAPIIEEEKIPQTRLSTMSTLCIAERTDADGSIDGVGPHIPARIPLYHGVALFPNRAQRAALHMQLLRLLTLEQDQRRTNTEKVPSGRASHAFLLLAAPSNIRRGDAAAVALALWRLRMFEENTPE